jgi:predicted MFS family arabinose efflux permease
MFRDLGRNNRFVMLAVFVWALSEGLWFNLRQIYLAELGATPEQIGTVLAVAAIAGAVVPIPAGLIADRVGPRRVMLVAWWLGVVGDILMALATTWQAVIPGKIVNKLSLAANPALVAYVLLNLPGRDQPGNSERIVTTVFGVYPAAMIFAPTLGGIIAEKANIRTDLWIAAGGVALATLVVSRTRHADSGDQTQRARPSRLFRNRTFLVLASYYTLTMVALYVGYLLAPNFLQDVRGFSLTMIGALFSIFSAGELTCNLVAGRIHPRWSFAGLLAVPWLAFLGLWQVHTQVGTGVVFFMLGGISTMWALVNAGIGRVAGAQYQGLALGIMTSLISLAMAIAAWIAGRLYDLTPTHDLPLIVGLVSIPLVLVLWFFMPLGPRPAPGASDNA